MGDKDLSSSEEVRRLSPAELRGLNKAQLVFALRTLIEEPAVDTEAGPGISQMARIERKLDDMMEKWNQDKEAMKSQIKDLRRDNEKLSETLAHHQRMLETLEAEKRAANLIVTGLPEESMEGAATDADKVRQVLTAINQQNVAVRSVERLGTLRADGEQRPGSRPYRRPIKIVLANSSDRPAVLENAKRLKEGDARFRNVYIKKDVHPLVRKELNRLREVTRREKEKPENQGRNVKFDYKERKVYVDDVVVDFFHSSSF